MDAEPLQHPAQAQDRQTHHVEKVTVQPLHQKGTQPLDAVGPGLVHGLAGADVAPELRLRGRAEIHVGGRALRQDLAAPADGDAGAYRVAAALKGRQHPQGVRLVHRLAETLVVQKHHGVGSDDDFLWCAESGGRVGLLPGDVLHRLPGGEAGGIGFLRPGDPDVEVRDADALEQLLPPGRAGGQYDLCHGRALTFRWSRSRPGRGRPDAPLW